MNNVDSRRRTTPVAAAGIILLLVAALGLAGCGGGDAGADLQAFCEAFREVDQAPSPPVGSDEHVQELNELVALAPDAVSSDLAAVRDHIDAEVSPDDPQSQEHSSLPPDVRRAAQRVDQFVEDHCSAEPR